ncbi:uncharacterized protein LOC109276369 [Panthera pardus]|uniref:Uncharacterized protein LOC109276369 n=1 Tax=Panthera pardus TaxID=9691 RepID=A0A9W2UZJ9_PANPR|nr:uncharacterized protein LOC109276369 [Panthera pardus]
MAETTKLWGMAPVILKMSKDPTNFYIGRSLWFSITFLYVSVVYVVQITWLRLFRDFQCHGNISKVCLAECYENHFTRPVLGVWYTVGFAFSTIFFVMEFLVCQSVRKLTKIFRKESLGKKPSDTHGNTEYVKANEDEIFDLSREKPLLAMYLVYFLIQLSIQVIFLAILIHYHLPLIKTPIWCSTPMCHGPYECVLLGTQEKMMSIIILATYSVVIMMFCIMFFLYTINTYLAMGRKFL